MRLSSPAAARNVGPIGDVLEDWLPHSGLVLEIASGSGEHALAFARRFPRLQWQPSDPDPQARASIAEWREAEGPVNSARRRWRSTCATHIGRSSEPMRWWRSTWCISARGRRRSALIEGAARVLGEDGALILYGPWLVDGIETAPSNLAFDADLKAPRPALGPAAGQ